MKNKRNKKSTSGFDMRKRGDEGMLIPTILGITGALFILALIVYGNTVG